jgi:hypothetical protein
LLKHPQHAIITKIATESVCVKVFIVEDQSQSGFLRLLAIGKNQFSTNENAEQNWFNRERNAINLNVI